MGDIMKCDRCGKREKGNEIETEERYITLCDECLDEFFKFIDGNKLCKCNRAYFTVMYKEDRYEN